MSTSDAREIWELYDCRAALEGLTTGEAVALAGDDDIAVLEGIVARNAAPVDFPDDAVRNGKALHTAIGEIAANDWAPRLHDQVSSQVERYRRFTNNSEDRRHDALAQHRELVEAIKARRDEALRAVGSDSSQPGS